MIDSLAVAVDIAFDQAITRRRRLIIDDGRTFIRAVVPGWLGWSLPDAKTGRTRIGFLRHVVGRVANEGPGEALGDKCGVDRRAVISVAHRQSAAIVVEVAAIAGDRTEGQKLT